MHDKPISMLRKKENIFTGTGKSYGSNYSESSSSEQTDNDTYRGFIEIHVDLVFINFVDFLIDVTKSKRKYEKKY